MAEAAACTGCHTGAAGSTTSVPVSLADNTIHDTCSTCHDEANGDLKAVYGRVQAMPDGGADTNNGGGTCEACHTMGFSGSHPTIDHR